LPKTPLRVVVDHTGKAVTDAYPAEQLDLQLTPGKMDDVLDNEMLMETVIPSMISAATKYAEALGAQEMKAGLQRMNLILDHEIERLKSLQMKNNNIRPEEILIAQQDKASLASLIGNARIRLDALQLIRKGKF
jgi:ATP-dependent helicase HepA